MAMGFRSGLYFGSAVYFEYVFVFFLRGGLCLLSRKMEEGEWQLMDLMIANMQ